ncbi:unnamed protein product [Alternaria alternata]
MKGHPKFDLEGEFLSHMQEIHEQRIEGMRFSLIKNMFRHPTKSLKGTCNLCRIDSEDLKSHLSEHLQRMARFALPQVDETARSGQSRIDAASTHKKYNLKDGESSISSPPRSSTSSPRPRDTTQQQYLSRQISASIDSTIIGVPHNETQIRRFLPKGDLTNILSEQALRTYLEELLSGSTDEFVKNALDRIIGDPERDEPPRRALLALFLYHQRSGLLHYFKNWLLSRQNDFPSDRWLPFDQNRLTNTIPTQYHEYIKDYQYIFIPSTLKEDMHQEFQSKERLPYIGAPLAVTDGSSGTVFTREVAPGHWEERLKNGRYAPADTTKPTVLAFKVFSGGHTGQEAGTSFEIEHSMLEDLRNNNLTHKMILLHSGSFVIRDETRIIQHCLIFERATCTLEDFLTDEKETLKSWTGSLLLTNLIELVQALACLHDNFNTLHLDIKPGNILVFDRPPSQSEDGNLEEAKFEWKISNFGLARKRYAKERTGPLYDRNRSASQSASLFATRPAGRFQAPEVQRRGSSKASRGSDVWSMGCVILMVLGFLVDGPSRVLRLLNNLQLEIEEGGVIDNSFYVTSDTFEWRSVVIKELYRFDYLDEHDPVIGSIPEAPQMKVAVHPEVVKWSNQLFRWCNDRLEQPILRDALGIVFLRVLLIDKSDRIDALSLSKYLASMRDRLRRIEEAFAESGKGRMKPKSSYIRDTDLHNIIVPPIPLVEVSRDYMAPASAEPLPVALGHSKLCSAITQIGSASSREQTGLRKVIQEELKRDGSQVREPCPLFSCQSHPINVAIRHKSYEALEELLIKANPGDLSIPCSGCGDRTPLEEACDRPGDAKALKYFKLHKSEFRVTRKFYDDHKINMTKPAKEALKELLQDEGQQQTAGGLIRRILTGKSNGS